MRALCVWVLFAVGCQCGDDAPKLTEAQRKAERGYVRIDQRYIKEIASFAKVVESMPDQPEVALKKTEFTEEEIETAMRQMALSEKWSATYAKLMGRAALPKTKKAPTDDAPDGAPEKSAE